MMMISYLNLSIARDANNEGKQFIGSPLSSAPSYR